MIADALKKVVLGENLSRSEAEDVMKEIMEGQCDPALVGAILVALRMKGETADEIAGFVNIMRQKAVTVSPARQAVDTCGTGGDGTGTINISTFSGILAAACGAAVAKHGNRAVSSGCGSADVLEALNIPIEGTPESIARDIDDKGFGFMFAPRMHPAMKYVMPTRKALGMRTVFNILGPMTNPANVKRQVIGVFDRSLCSLVAEALGELGSEHVLVVHGSDKMDELSLSAPTHVAELHDGKISNYEFKPEDAGLARCNLEDLKGSDAAGNADLARQLFTGRQSGPVADAVCLNTGACLYVSGMAGDIADGVSLAQKHLADGAAAAKLDELIITR